MAFTKFTYVRSLLAAKIHGERRLLSLSLCVTNRCNIACLYCYGDYYFRQGKNPEVDDLLKVIDDACALGLQHLYLTGGEPLIRPDIGAIVERAADHGLRTGMVTNGYFLPRQVKNLKRLDKVVLSLDGREGPNDANRGKSCFAKVARAIACCQTHGLAFDLKMVLNRNNAGELPWMLDHAERLGVKLEVVLAYAPASEVQRMQHAHLMLSKAERDRLTAELLVYKHEGRPLMFSAPVYENMARWYRYHEADMVEHDAMRADFPYIACNAGIYHAFVDGDGLMYPCNQIISTFPARHVVRDGVKAAWDNLADNRCRACNVTFLNHQHLTHDLHLTYPLKQLKWNLTHRDEE